MPIFERVRRKLSRSKSTGGGSSGIITKPIPDNNDHAEGQIRIDPSWPTTALSLTPSDENLVSKLAFSPDTEFIERPPRLRTPSVAATQFSERTVFNNVESGFLSLPTELLLFLQPYLTPSSEVALRHTCSRFFHLYTLPSFVLKGKDLFDFLCMTERDQDPADLDRLVCGRCQELHVKTTFPASEVTRPPTARDCRTVWLCAHRTLGYAKTIRNVKPGVDSPFRVETLDPCSRCRNFIRTRSVAERPEKGTSQTDLESPKTQSLLITKVALLQAPSPLPYGTRRERSSSSGVVGGGGGGGGSTGGTSSGVYKELFSAKDVSDALSALDFRLCPHMKLGDPYILSKFCRACINTQRLPVGVKGPPCINDWKKKSNDLDDLVSGINNSIHNYMRRRRRRRKEEDDDDDDDDGGKQVQRIVLHPRLQDTVHVPDPGILVARFLRPEASLAHHRGLSMVGTSADRTEGPHLDGPRRRPPGTEGHEGEMGRVGEAEPRADREAAVHAQLEYLSAAPGGFESEMTTGATSRDGV
ncbi:hypothetical protein LTS17_003692 [Exophiala oligosperma]